MELRARSPLRPLGAPKSAGGPYIYKSASQACPSQTPLNRVILGDARPPTHPRSRGGSPRLRSARPLFPVFPDRLRPAPPLLGGKLHSPRRVLNARTSLTERVTGRHNSANGIEEGAAPRIGLRRPHDNHQRQQVFLPPLGMAGIRRPLPFLK